MRGWGGRDGARPQKRILYRPVDQAAVARAANLSYRQYSSDCAVSRDPSGWAHGAVLGGLVTAIARLYRLQPQHARNIRSTDSSAV